MSTKPGEDQIEDYNKYVEQIKDLNSVKTQIMNNVISVKISELEEIFILFKNALKESLEINFSTYQVLYPLASKTHKKVKFPLLDKEDIADKVAKNSSPSPHAAGEMS